MVWLTIKGGSQSLHTKRVSQNLVSVGKLSMSPFTFLPLPTLSLLASSANYDFFL